MADVFYLARFRNAHENGLKGSGRGTYEQALQDIRNGRKMGHWMWYNSMPASRFSAFR